MYTLNDISLISECVAQMEHCTFHKGKRKILESEAVDGRRNDTFLNDFNAKCSKLMFQIDCELNKLYEEVVFEVATFTKSYWEDALRPSGLCLLNLISSLSSTLVT